MKGKKILVTGGCGFMGSEFVKQAVSKGHEVVVIDKLSYAGDIKRLEQVKGKFGFYKEDICQADIMRDIIKKEKPYAIVHYAAETHVDRSIEDATPFNRTNVIGTQVLLDCMRKFELDRFLYISTDEVYGEIEEGQFLEQNPLSPNSPYAVSKAAADMMVTAYIRTYGINALVVRPCNNYGPWQYREKLIPVIIQNALKDKPVPVYADGQNMREWLYVEDSAQGVLRALEKGEPGQVYNLGSGKEKKNIEVVHAILDILGKSKDLVQFVKDRPGHDIRYSLNTDKIRKKLGWQPGTFFEDGLNKTVRWYKENRNYLS